MALHASTVAMRSGRMAFAGGAAMVLMLLADPAAAALNNLALLDKVVEKFSTQASTWQSVMMNAASWLFWTLGTISLAWTGGMMVLRKADMAEFFAEFIRFILFFGFFLWLLRNGPDFASSIIESMQKLGASATNRPSITPSTIVDVGFKIWQQAVTNISALNPVASLVGILLSAAILLMLAAIAVNMLLLLVSGWILMYAGIFFLGFGGSRWTSDMAINYYKTVLGVGVQLMTMILLVGIGNDLLTDFYSRFNGTENNLNEMIIMVVLCLVLLMLVTKVPSMVAGMVTGGVGASSDLGSFGAGALMGAAVGAAGAAGKVSAAASMAGAVMRAGVDNAAGGTQALMAAYTQAAGARGGDTGHMPYPGGSEGRGDTAEGASAFAEMDFGKGRGSDAAKAGASSKSSDSSSAGSDGGSSSKPGAVGAGGGGGVGGGAPGGQETGASQGDTSSSDPSASGSQGGGGFGRALATAAGTVGYLAQGSLAVGQDKMVSLRSQARERGDETVGARFSAAIKRSILPSVGSRTQHASEVEAFVQRDSDKG